MCKKERKKLLDLSSSILSSCLGNKGAPLVDSGNTSASS